MIIDDKLIRMGVTEKILLHFHNKTKNKNSSIDTAVLAPFATCENGINVDVVLSSGRSCRYHINISKVRNRILNSILL